MEASCMLTCALLAWYICNLFRWSYAPCLEAVDDVRVNTAFLLVVSLLAS